MTNLEALQGKIAGYPLKDATYLTALMDRGLTPQDLYAGKNKAFELAMADIYVVLATGVNVSEGGYQLSITHKATFLRVANGIYEKHGEKSPFSDTQPKVEGASPW